MGKVRAAVPDLGPCWLHVPEGPGLEKVLGKQIRRKLKEKSRLREGVLYLIFPNLDLSGGYCVLLCNYNPDLSRGKAFILYIKNGPT